MSEEQKRQWAMILWYHENVPGPIEMGILLFETGVTKADFESIKLIKNSFTEQPKP